MTLYNHKEIEYALNIAKSTLRERGQFLEANAYGFPHTEQGNRPYNDGEWKSAPDVANLIIEESFSNQREERVFLDIPAEDDIEEFMEQCKKDIERQKLLQQQYKIDREEDKARFNRTEKILSELNQSINATKARQVI